MRKIKIYFLKIDSVRGKEDHLFSVLPKERADKAKRFVLDDDKSLSLAAGYLIHRFIGSYFVDEFGKPRAQNAFFSVSHSFEFAALAVVSGREVGLDIEKERVEKGEEDLAKYCLDDREMQAYRQGKEFLSLFTAKESLAKAEGRGIAEIRSIPALPLNGRVKYNDKDYYRHSKKINGYHVSVTLQEEDFEVETEEIYVE